MIGAPLRTESGLAMLVRRGDHVDAVGVVTKCPIALAASAAI